MDPGAKVVGRRLARLEELVCRTAERLLVACGCCKGEARGREAKARGSTAVNLAKQGRSGAPGNHGGGTDPAGKEVGDGEARRGPHSSFYA